MNLSETGYETIITDLPFDTAYDKRLVFNNRLFFSTSSGLYKLNDTYDGVDLCSPDNVGPGKIASNGKFYYGVSFQYNQTHLARYSSLSSSFLGDVLTGQRPKNVNFTSTSASDFVTSPVTGYSWDFGDGNTSTDENPSNNFVDSGSYDITFTVSSDIDELPLTKENYISISEPYRIIYHGSGNTEGTVPIDSTEYYHGDTAIVLGPGGMKKEPYVFYAWTDSPYGYGYIHFPGDELIMLQNRHVYASWVGSSNYIGGLIGKS
jgi:PKD repeat protein